MPHVSLPMYYTAANAADWNVLWGCIANALRVSGFDAPDHLLQPDDLAEHWCEPDLLLSQSCGLPYLRFLKDKVNILGAIDFDLPGCAPGQYNSLIVSRSETPWDELCNSGRPAINDCDSQSGANVLSSLGLDLENALETGAHVYSAQAVADGRADFAAIDAHTWRLIDADIRDQLNVLFRSKPTPGLPLICSNRFDATKVADALERGFADVSRGVLERLWIKDLVRLSNSDYLVASAF